MRASQSPKNLFNRALNSGLTRCKWVSERTPIFILFPLFDPQKKAWYHLSDQIVPGFHREVKDNQKDIIPSTSYLFQDRRTSPRETESCSGLIIKIASLPRYPEVSAGIGGIVVDLWRLLKGSSIKRTLGWRPKRRATPYPLPTSLLPSGSPPSSHPGLTAIVPPDTCGPKKAKMGTKRNETN